VFPHKNHYTPILKCNGVTIVSWLQPEAMLYVYEKYRLDFWLLVQLKYKGGQEKAIQPFFVNLDGKTRGYETLLLPWPQPTCKEVIMVIPIIAKSSLLFHIKQANTRVVLRVTIWELA
jgi:hypothetical protein